jgi:hypothetical protein
VSVGSVGSISFWQQDQNFWAQGQRNDQTQSEAAVVITQMFNATSTLSGGLSSIANQTALNRVNSALSSAVQSALQSETGSSTASSSSDSTVSSSGSTSSGASSPTVAAAPATGTGTAPLATSTSLFTLGILAKGTITVSDGTNMTTYTSTGTDTVGNLINAINSGKSGNAAVTASLNLSGDLVLTGNNATASVIVGGTYAANIGFGAKNDTFLPTAPSSNSSNTSTASSSSSSSSAATSSTGLASSGTSSSTGSSTGSALAGLLNSAYALQTGGTAELLLASSGSSGTLLDLLA